MAEGGDDPLSLSLEKLDAELTCPVCTEHFKEPKVLPCLHYYCKTCIADLIKRANGQPFNCPECRRETRATNDPESFPTAFFLNRMEDIYSVMKKADPKQSSNCESCAKLPSVSFCYDCKEYICTDCVRYHQWIHTFSTHRVVSIESLRTNISKFSADTHAEVVKCTMMCNKHEDEPLKLYCRDCCKLVCHDCVLIDHKDHKYAFVTDTAPLSKTDIRKWCEAVKILSEDLSSVVSSLTNSDKKLTDHETVTKQTIDGEINGVIARAEEKRREMKEKAGRIVSEAREKVYTQKKNAELAVGEVESLVEFMNRTLERATDHEVLSLEKQMSDQVERVSQLYGNPADKFPVPTLPELVVDGGSSATNAIATNMSISQRDTYERKKCQGKGRTASEWTKQPVAEYSHPKSRWTKQIVAEYVNSNSEWTKQPVAQRRSSTACPRSKQMKPPVAEFAHPKSEWTKPPVAQFAHPKSERTKPPVAEFAHPKSEWTKPPVAQFAHPKSERTKPPVAEFAHPKSERTKPPVAEFAHPKSERTKTPVAEFAHPKSEWTKPPVSEFAHPKSEWTKQPVAQFAHPKSEWTKPPVSEFAHPKSEWTKPPVAQFAHPKSEWTKPPVSEFAHPKSEQIKPPVAQFAHPKSEWTKPPVSEFAHPKSERTKPPVAEFAHPKSERTKPPVAEFAHPKSERTKPPVAEFAHPKSERTKPPVAEFAHPKLSEWTKQPVARCGSSTTYPRSKQIKPPVALKSSSGYTMIRDKVDEHSVATLTRRWEKM